MTFPTDLFLEYKKRPERAALARLLERHQDAVYTLCYQVLRHPQDAEDACQEVLLEVSRQVDSVEEPGKFSAWLYRTAIHTALDVRRKRERQRARDAGASRAPGGEPQPPEATEALHQGLARLDDTSRTLVVEHYFGRRPLRELAAERGCSEVAVWKRIRNAKERLRKVLGSGAVAALDGMAKVSAPAGLLQKALGLSGGLAMATKAGIKLAIVAPLLLLAGAGAILVTRRSEAPPPPRVELPTTTGSSPLSAALSVPEGGSPPVAAATPDRAGQRPRSRVRRPYPFGHPSGRFPDAVVRTWSILTSKRVTLDIQNESLFTFVKEIGELADLRMIATPGFENDALSIKVQDLLVDQCLKLTLSPRGLGYDILSDGIVIIAAEDKVTQGYSQAIRDAMRPLEELNRVRQEMDGGWDGLPQADPTVELDRALRTRRIVASQGETTLEAEIPKLNVMGVQVFLEPPDEDGPDIVSRWEAYVRRPILQVVSESLLADHLNALARSLGLVAVPHQGMVFITAERNAANYRRKNDDARRDQERDLARLQKPVDAHESAAVPDFLESLRRSHGLKVIPSEEAWNSGETLCVPAGTTLRQGLDQLRTHGFRWALRDGRLYVLK